jgi:hypothetical protein
VKHFAWLHLNSYVKNTKPGVVANAYNSKTLFQKRKRRRTKFQARIANYREEEHQYLLAICVTGIWSVDRWL